MTIRGAVLLADKQMPVTKRLVNTSNLPALDNLEWVNVGHPLSGKPRCSLGNWAKPLKRHPPKLNQPSYTPITH